MKVGVVDVGGGMRGIFAAGVMDFCLEKGVNFDVCLGVSAGSANVISYIAGQKGRNYRFYSEYSFRKEYMSLHNFLKKRSYIDLDYVYGTLSNSGGENPLDYDAFIKSDKEIVVVATDAMTGLARYFTKEDIPRDHYDVLKASCAIPFVCHPYKVGEIPYFDGALSDPVPIEKAFSMGCDKVVLILTKPSDVIRSSGKDEIFAHRIQKKYPLAAEGLRNRARRYNHGVELAKQYQAEGRLIIVAPDDTCGMDTLTRDVDAMNRFYESGKRAAWKIIDNL